MSRIRTFGLSQYVHLFCNNKINYNKIINIIIFFCYSGPVIKIYAPLVLLFYMYSRSVHPNLALVYKIPVRAFFRPVAFYYPKRWVGLSDVTVGISGVVNVPRSHHQQICFLDMVDVAQVVDFFHLLFFTLMVFVSLLGGDENFLFWSSKQLSK